MAAVGLLARAMAGLLAKEAGTPALAVVAAGAGLAAVFARFSRSAVRHGRWASPGRRQ